MFIVDIWDHPRLRGEKQKNKEKHNLVEGSPPLARGKGSKGHCKKRFVRITPACAGKRLSVCKYPLGKQDHPRLRGAEFRDYPKYREDHPRLRGEKITIPLNHRSAQGSPPLARGKAAESDNANSEERITPACAGKRQRPSPKAGYAKDHPRLRGEKICLLYQLKYR